MMHFPLFILVCFVALGVTWAMALLTRGIVFFGTATNNEKQIMAAANSDKWRWPSDMHKYAGDKARMKDVGVLGVALLQRLTKNKTNEYPLILLCNLSVGISSVLLYVAALHYWDERVALLLFALFLFSLWPHQITLAGGYHCLSQMFLLASVCCLQATASTFSWMTYGLYSAAGVFLALMLFASASGRKFLPLFLGAFLFSQRNVLEIFPSEGKNWNLVLYVAGLMVCTVVFASLFYKRVIQAVYLKKGPSWFHSLLRSRDRVPLERYLGLRRKFIKVLVQLSMAVFCYFLACFLFVRNIHFYSVQFFLFFGFIAAVLFLTLPDVLKNVRGFLDWWFVSYDYCHFRLYVDFFKKIGKPISPDMRGAGLRWIVLFFFRVIPFQSALYFCCFCFLCWVWVLKGYSFIFLYQSSAVFLLSLSPIIYGEMTRSPQFGRTYFPALLGLLILTAYGAWQLEMILPIVWHNLYWAILALGAFLSAVWNTKVFLSDVLPSRMAPTNLIKVLQTLEGEKFYTYNTPFNSSFVDVIPSDVKAKIAIQYINSLHDVKEGYILVPGVSSKAWTMECYEHGIQNRDFDADAKLMHFIDSKEILKYAVASFKTFGSSKIWVHESEMPTYRELILKDISEKDRWRGLAWIIDAGKLQGEIACKN